MRFSRSWLASAITPVVIGAAAAVAVATLTGPSGQARPGSGHAWLTVAVRPAPAAARGSGLPAVVNCAGKDQTRPGSFVLACADANSQLLRLSWQTWQQSAAYGSGTWNVNDCVPNCSVGTFHNYPALVVLWRPQPLPGKTGGQYFSRLTMILTGPHCYTAGGKRACYPVTATTGLWSHI
jgi:hypothetical protein